MTHDTAARNNAPETQPKKVVGRPFQPGNPGRPKGSRNKLNEAFVADFFAAWEEHGKDALIKVAQEDPSTFVRVAASLLPRQVKVEHTINELTDEQLEQRARDLAADLGIPLGLAAGMDRGAGGAQAPDRADNAPPVSTLQ